MMRLFICALVFVTIANCVAADDPTNKIREGMRLYSAEQFEEAGKSFAAATESYEKARSDKAAISAFDEACALHRNGALELARERYLKAGLSQDKGIATSAHFNMGVIASEQARKLAGENPETVPADKRKEILDELSRSIDSYRHCLELQPQHVPARRNLELLRQWIKYHIDRWREADLKKRRDETNLVQFLDYLVQAQLSLKQTAEAFRSNTSPNAFAELKRVQEELKAEIPYLKDKIDLELRPKKDEPSTSSSNANSAQSNEDLESGIALLSGWADQAGERMTDAGRELMKRDAIAAADKQQRAADQLDQIWDAVVPFYPLLAKELAEQTQIAKLEVQNSDWSQLLEQQERVLRKTRLLSPKAESELAQVESHSKASESENETPPAGVDDAGSAPSNVDPEAIKAGYQKALELAPKAIEEMESAVKQLGRRDRDQAASHTEQARRILKEMQDAQPKQPEQDQNDPNKDQDKNQPQENDQKKDKDEDQKKNENEEKTSKDDEKNSDEQKQDKQQEEKKKADADKKDKEKQAEQRPEPKISQDRIEEALRRVREREQEKRERDRELRARVLGRVPVDKDW